MAGKDAQELYCLSIKTGELVINLASTRKGAVRIGLELNGKANCLEYFGRLLPGYQVVEDETANSGLINAVSNALKGGKVHDDLRLDIQRTDFQSVAWKTIACIPFGETRTYGEVAVMMGMPGAARAVGQAMNRNPLPLIFP
jgi:O6-methylguanine-DNA--protein-cysteine methyltransferase